MPGAVRKNDGAPDVRKAAAESIEKIGDPSVAGALRRRVEDEVWHDPKIHGVEDPTTGGKAAALRALRKLAPDQVTPALITALGATHGHMRSWAALELAAQKDNRKAIPDLKKRVADHLWYDSNYVGDFDPEWGGKAAALKLLRELDAGQATRALLNAVRSSTLEVQLWAVEELMGQPDSAKNAAFIEALIGLLGQKDGDDKEKVALLAKRGKHPRRVAAECLLQLRAKAAVPALKKRVADGLWYESGYGNVPSDPVGGGKEAALAALRELAPREVKVALTLALKSDNAKVREWAVGRLAEEGTDPK
jgi:HEAT repeat protein